MKKVFTNLFFIGLLSSSANFFSAFELIKEPFHIVSSSLASDLEPALKQEAFEILKTKCNVCHRKQNPFKIFSLKNMKRHAPKIHQQVFVKKRMPKGNKIRLTEEEYQTLKNWINALKTKTK